MPFFHGGGSIWGLMTMLAQGGTLVFTETNDGETAAKLIVENECTATMGVPPNFYGMFEVMDREQQRITSVRAAASGGQLLEDMRERLGPVEFTFSPYGMTELYGPAVLTDVDDSEELRAEGWIRPLDGQEMRVIDPATGDDVEPGGIGEIRMRGLAMLGYYHLPQQTATTIDPDGWVHSEDLVAFREGGYIRYVGRMKAMLKVGGENVAVEEVEGIVRAFPGVVEACVIGVPDAKKGELPRAYVVSAKDATIDRDELDAFCSERLARYKVPRDYLIVESIPMTGSGKPDRAAIIAQDAEAAGLEHIQA
jgi:fatty-acyl-CoA synthase